MQTRIVLIIAALAWSGCSSAPTRPQPAAAEPEAAQTETRPAPAKSGGMMGHDMTKMCPMAVAGTTSRAEDVEGGAAMVFTTTGDVAELRRRVTRMAAMHNQPPQEGGKPGGMMGGEMKMPQATALTEDVEGGARLVLTAKAPEKVAELREHVRNHAAKMASGHCPMMSHG
jgi:hypothetical protein